MADTKIGVDLSPESVIKSLRDMGEETKKLAQAIEDSLGKKAAGDVEKLAETSQKGAGKISSTFRNLATRMKQDLKSAFDATGIAAGTKLAQEIATGVRSVFEMERAFDRLNTRLQLSGRAYSDFKKNVGSAVAGTGQKLEDVLPGVERLAARGNVKDSGQLQQMAGMLAQVRATTGEDVGGLADSLAAVMKDQGKEVNAQNTKMFLDTAQASRTRGTFQTAGEAATAMQAISPYAKQMNLSTQTLGGLTAIASRSGQGGQDILQQLIHAASEYGGARRLNTTLGQNVFKGGPQGRAVGMNVEALGKVNMANPKIMETITGLTGASGADLERFINAFKNGMDKFGEVTNSYGESQKQFDMATDNFATTVAKFKRTAMEAGRQIGGGLSEAAHALTKGDVGGIFKGLGKSVEGMWDNLGTVVGATTLGAGAGMLLGGGINSLLKKVPGAGGVAGRVAGSAAGGAMAEASGVQKVYVVNASEIGSGIGDLAGFGAMPKQLAMMTGVGGAVVGGAAVGATLANTKGGQGFFDYMLGNITDAAIGGNSKEELALKESQARSQERYGGFDQDKMTEAFVKAGDRIKIKMEGQLINPSSLHPATRGAPR